MILVPLLSHLFQEMCAFCVIHWSTLNFANTVSLHWVNMNMKHSFITHVNVFLLILTAWFITLTSREYRGVSNQRQLECGAGCRTRWLYTDGLLKLRISCTNTSIHTYIISYSSAPPDWIGFWVSAVRCHKGHYLWPMFVCDVYQSFPR